jgi:hypothetical protein
MGRFRQRSTLQRSKVCVKTQGSFPTEDAALVPLFSLAATSHIKLRRIDAWQKIAAILNQRPTEAA